MGMGVDLRNRMARRAAKEIDPGMIVNLGIGIPSLVSNHIPTDMQVMFQAENGVLGMGESPEEGEENPMLCNAAGFPVSIVPGASYFDSATAFGIIRSGNLDITILGGLEVSEKGDLANWIVPGKRVPGIGGAMELAQKAKKVIVLMSHVNKHGEPKIVPECQLPLTAKACVDIIITDRAVIEVTEKGLLLKEVMAPYTADDVMKHTAAELMLSDQVTTLS
ncbi:acyl CoA:acetate/3-ketoacid CoA transferase subunit beta [Halobacillus halophilus]|uniref:CoA-transferase subunit B n=1 Tax=Halobacillus halophilus (strain ATCC 35676 / DSM 2266 / JCM 20832 / KCTC 3685 / LMG 17431 / NBRC 102448 / NCIMB 2269) TaxID=866895 RepID=I0JQU7_HALH3|nr:3-oxoacid CoA-transferase subunit B [Halobacillus halophilus]ASF40520.1 acyl CoA:acetate/3-ketoacid CoA transferase subunit beta [Halobacillus halophilus]CCG46517.1 CoA-transferase subunit B [Halobacillus halophilus DSM 2266]